MVVAPNGLRERKLAELAAKLDGIRHELAAWTSASEPGEELEKFHTRVRAVRNALEPSVEPLAVQLDDEASSSLEIAARFERAILDVHRIWEFFRSKLALRYVPHLRDYLIAADELAWRCFEPAQRYLGDIGREPPLLFLNGASSPFTMPRQSAYEPEDVPGEALSRAECAEVIESLPIPVIGVPWFALEHLPDALVIAHEVGHDVQRDLALDSRLDELVTGAVRDDARRRCWLAWRDELFADVYGALAGGPAFAGTLIDFIADAPRIVRNERPTAVARYPTRALRVAIVLEVLRVRGFAAQADAYGAAWAAAYDEPAAGTFHEDAPRVVVALLKGPYEQLCRRGLDALEPFSTQMQDLAAHSADDALVGVEPRASDARVLFAAARIAYEGNGTAYREAAAGRRLLQRICAEQQVGVRGTGEEAPPEGERDARDARAGQTLAAAIATRHDLTLDHD